MKQSVINLLKAHLGSVLTLHFDDGEVIDAKVLHIDDVSHKDFTFDVVRVRVPGPRTSYHRDSVYVNSLDVLVDASLPDE